MGRLALHGMDSIDKSRDAPRLAFAAQQLAIGNLSGSNYRARFTAMGRPIDYTAQSCLFDA